MNTLRQAAQALCDRWDTPLWKDVAPTAVFIGELREAIAREEAQVVEPVAYTTPFDWKSRETERIVKVTRKPQPEYDYTMPVHLAPATDRGALIITLRNFTYDPPAANALMRVAADMLAADAPFQPDWVNYRQGVEDGKAEAQQVAVPQDAHEIWAAAQLVPGEGIEDGVARVEALLDAPRVPMTEPEINSMYGALPNTDDVVVNLVRAVEAHHQIGVKP